MTFDVRHIKYTWEVVPIQRNNVCIHTRIIMSIMHISILLYLSAVHEIVVPVCVHASFLMHSHYEQISA